MPQTNGIVEGNLKSFRESDRGMTFFGPILSTAGLIQQSAIIPLTNAQILALPTTGIDAIAAPGAGKLLQVVAATLVIDSSAGAYTNVDPAGVLFLDYANVARKATGNGAAAGTIDGAQVSVFSLAGAGVGGVSTNFVNVKIQVAATNAAAGNFTGGNAANTGRLTIDFLIVTP